MRIIHNLSKEARTRIIELLLQKRSKKELAEELGLSPAAITKFLNNTTHPSDETIEKAFKIATDREKREIIDIILDDLLESLEEFVEETNIMGRKILKIKKIINSTMFS